MAHTPAREVMSLCLSTLGRTHEDSDYTSMTTTVHWHSC